MKKKEKEKREGRGGEDSPPPPYACVCTGKQGREGVGRERRMEEISCILFPLGAHTLAHKREREIMLFYFLFSFFPLSLSIYC